MFVSKIIFVPCVTDLCIYFLQNEVVNPPHNASVIYRELLCSLFKVLTKNIVQWFAQKWILDQTTGGFQFYCCFLIDLKKKRFNSFRVSLTVILSLCVTVVTVSLSFSICHPQNSTKPKLPNTWVSVLIDKVGFNLYTWCKLGFLSFLQISSARILKLFYSKIILEVKMYSPFILWQGLW